MQNKYYNDSKINTLQNCDIFFQTESSASAAIDDVGSKTKLDFLGKLLVYLLNICTFSQFYICSAVEL